jgi:alpha-glucosidase (family GH31 glycosyl hydrolase)
VLDGKAADVRGRWMQEGTFSPFGAIHDHHRPPGEHRYSVSPIGIAFNGWVNTVSIIGSIVNNLYQAAEIGPTARMIGFT